MREFYLAWPGTLVGAQVEKRQTLSDESGLRPFPLPWSHYVCLLSVKDIKARAFYETEVLRGGVRARYERAPVDFWRCRRRSGGDHS